MNKYAWSLNLRFGNLCLSVLVQEAVICCPETFLMAILILSETFFRSIINCIKNKYSEFVADLLKCKSRALKYLTGVNFIYLWAVKPNLPIENNVGNGNSSHCLSVINETGCLFFPGDM